MRGDVSVLPKGEMRGGSSRKGARGKYDVLNAQHGSIDAAPPSVSPSLPRSVVLCCRKCSPVSLLCRLCVNQCQCDGIEESVCVKTHTLSTMTT